LTAYKGYSYILVTGSRVVSFSVYYQVCRGGGAKANEKDIDLGLSVYSLLFSLFSFS